MERGGEDRKRSTIEHHPVTRKATPFCNRVRVFWSRAGRGLHYEDEKVDEGVGEKEVEEEAKSIRRPLRDHLPKIFAGCAANPLLSYKGGRKKHDKDTYVKNEKEILWCHASTEDSADMNP